MKTVQTLLLVFCLALFFTTCDIVEPPFAETSNAGPAGPVSGTVRKVLLEDFTGHKCGNCPRAGETADALKEAYGDQLIVYAAHVGSFAEPEPVGVSYTYDFRTSVGDEIDATFNISSAGLPGGMVNRKEIGGSPLIDYGDWGATTSDILTSPPDASIGITSTYNSANRELEANVTTEFLNPLNGNYNLCVYLTEDSIINWQKDYQASPKDIEFFTHRHILRGSMNNTWGEEIVNGSVAVGDSTTNTYTTVLDTGWAENHMSIVAFLYDFSTKEVLQAEEIHLQH
jgi:hypothetical protein